MADFPSNPASPGSSPTDQASESNAEYVKRTSVTVGELRKSHGSHFAPGFQDSDKIGEVLARAGVNTLEELLQQSKAT